jgi:L-fuconolactonase
VERRHGGGMTKNDSWLALTREDALEPDLPICDPHHHLWMRDGQRYVLDEFMADANCGHNIVSTVFMECGAMYRADGPDDLKPVGETVFADGIASKSASGDFGQTRVAAGIVGFADLRLGAAVETVLDAHMESAPARFRGIRFSTAFDPDIKINRPRTHAKDKLFTDTTFHGGLKVLFDMGLSFDAWLYHRQIPELTDLARAFPDAPIVLDHCGGRLGLGPYADKER